MFQPNNQRYNMIVPQEQHFVGRVTYRGSGVLKTIRDKVEKLGLRERVEGCPFKQFFTAAELQFSGVLVHQLLLRKIEAKNPNELHFKLGSNACRFGPLEFALVTGLNFSQPPTTEELKEHLNSDRLIQEYFNGSNVVKISQLETAFKDCDRPDDVWKLGLCLLIEGVFYAKEKEVGVWGEMLKMVEDLEFFYKFPWGHLCWEATLKGLNKDMLKHQANLKKKLDFKATQQKEAKYTVYGFAPALQYWAYEAIPEIGTIFGAKLGNRVPRMLSWSSRKAPSLGTIGPILNKKRLTTFAMLKPRPIEATFYNGLVTTTVILPYPGLRNIVVNPEGEVAIDMEDETAKVAATAKEVRDFSETEHAAAETGSSSAPHPSIMVSLDGLDARVTGVEEKLSLVLKDQDSIMEKLNVLLSREPPVADDADGEDGVMPDDEMPTDGSITPGVTIESANVEFKMRKRQAPVRFEDSTVSSTKRPCMEGNGDIKWHLLKQTPVFKWMPGQIPDEKWWDVKADDVGPAWLLQMITSESWLWDSVLESLTAGSQSSHSGGNLLPLQGLVPLAEIWKIIVLSIENHIKELEDNLFKSGLEIEGLESQIEMLKEHKEEVEHIIEWLQDSAGPCLPSFPSRFSTKEEVIEEIEKRDQSAAAILCNILCRGVPFEEPHSHYFARDVIGIVALLGTVHSLQLSRILSEYLGVDRMLAVVVRSFEAASALENRRNREVDFSNALHAEAIRLGKPIHGRFLVICLEDIRPFFSGFEPGDSQRKMALKDPLLPNGTAPLGFLGFAVNMINLDADHLSIKTSSGHGLRETLLYRLFGKLQVYRTTAEMLAAQSYIKCGGAVSLDGGILKENGMVSLGFGEPEICFQVVTTESEAVDSQENLEHLEMHQLELSKTNKVLAEVMEEHDIKKKIFKTKKDEYHKLMNRVAPVLGTQETGD